MTDRHTSGDQNFAELQTMGRIERQMEELTKGVNKIHQDLAMLTERMKRQDELALRLSAAENAIVNHQLKMESFEPIKKIVYLLVVGVLSSVGVAIVALVINSTPK